MSRSEKGFTLIELMIVIAIIAIIAAIAIPGLLQSQRASNERNASASLKTMATAEADFRANDRDQNRVQDFWTGNVAALYSLLQNGSTEMIKLIDISIATGDYCHTVQGTATNTAAVAGPAVLDSTGSYVTPTGYGVPSAKAGYWYKAMTTDETGATALSVDTSGVTNSSGTGAQSTGGRNYTKFGFIAFPDSFSSGRAMFVVNEGNTIFKRVTTGNVKPGPTTPSAAVLTPANYQGGGTQAVERWPSDVQLKSYYSKLD